MTNNSAVWLVTFFGLMLAGLWFLARTTAARLTGEEERDRNLLYRAKSHSSWVATFSLIALLVARMAFQGLSLPVYLAALLGGIGFFYLALGFLFRRLDVKASGNRQTVWSVARDTWRIVILCFLPMVLYGLVLGGMLPVYFYLSEAWFVGSYRSLLLAVAVGFGLAATAALTPWGLRFVYRARRVHEGRVFRAAQRAGESFGRAFVGIYLFPASPAGRVLILTDLHGKLAASDNTEALFSDRELNAIALHEAAHLKMKHPLRLLSASIAICLITVFSLDADLLKVFEWIEDNVPIARTTEAISLLLSAPILLVLCLAIVALPNHFSRRAEYAADRAAVLHGASPDDLISALTKLHQRNLMASRWTWTDRFFQTHPSLNSRIERIKKT